MNEEIKCKQCDTVLSYTINKFRGGTTIKSSRDCHVFDTEKEGKFNIICKKCEYEFTVEIQ